jgi:hypothetical protein
LTELLAVTGRPSAMLVVVPMPLPDSATVVGLLLALLVTVSVPVRLPATVGVNATLTVQEPPTAMVEQLFVWVKSPLADTADTVADAVPLLLTITACVAVVLPTTVLANDRLAGFGFRIGPGATPVPLSDTLVVVPPAVTARVPLCGPELLGANVTLYEHDELAASALPQVVASANCPLIVAETDVELLPVLLTVTLCALLVLPVATEPKDNEVGVTETPVSFRYGGHTGAGDWPFAQLELSTPELPPPSVMTKLVPSQL